jgi:DNA-directed RNA polymerase specialized sigma24 family protein
MPQLPGDRTADLQESLKGLQRQFLASLADIRPKLHRFCARMCGSAMDGEDLVQETLAQAFFRLPTLKDHSRLEAWLFCIAHRKCLDFLRATRRAREETVSSPPSRRAPSCGGSWGGSSRRGRRGRHVTAGQPWAAVKGLVRSPVL